MCKVRIHHPYQLYVTWDENTSAFELGREMYTVLMDLFDNPANMDYPVPIGAVTSYHFVLKNGWEINSDAVDHLRKNHWDVDWTTDDSNINIVFLGIGVRVPTAEFFNSLVE